MAPNRPSPRWHATCSSTPRTSMPCGPGSACAMPDDRRILLVRLDGLGDALACVPALEGLRRACAGARFGAVCSRENCALFSSDRMERVHVYAGEPDAELLAGLRAAGYTDALIATEEPVGYRLAAASGARRRVGFWHRFEKTFKSLWQFLQLTDRVYRPAAWIAQPEHEVAALYRLAERLGARRPIPNDAALLRPWLNVTPPTPTAPADRARVLALQVTPKLASGGWGPAAIAGFTAAALDASTFDRCRLLAAAADEGLARSIMEQLPRGLVAAGRAILVPPADLAGWLGEIRASDALVTPDTGAAHAAGMLGVPVVDLFDPERYDQLSRQWRPW